MRRTLIVFTVFLSLFISAAPTFLLSGQASAANVFPSVCGSGSVNSTPAVCNDVNSQGGNNGSNDPIIKIIRAAIEVLSYIIGAAAIIGILASGLRMIISNGDSNAIASARTSLAYSLIGVAVAALAQIIVIFVLSKV